MYLYHGQDRVHDPAWLEQQDLVITSYATLAAEMPAEDRSATNPPSQKNKKRKCVSGGLLEVSFGTGITCCESLVRAQVDTYSPPRRVWYWLVYGQGCAERWCTWGMGGAAQVAWHRVVLYEVWPPHAIYTV